MLRIISLFIVGLYLVAGIAGTINRRTADKRFSYLLQTIGLSLVLYYVWVA